MESKTLETTTYLIQSDDTIRTIASKFQTTPQQLIKLNGNKPLIIQTKHQIKVPLPSNSKLHVVTEGECIRDLLIRFKLSPDELISLNQNLFLQPGQLITIER